MTDFQLTIDVTSLTTDNTLYDETLAEADWFNFEQFPEAYFVAENVDFFSTNEASISGDLTIKERTVPLQFVLRSQHNQLTTSFKLQRQELGLGQEADPEGEWVSKIIEVEATLQL